MKSQIKKNKISKYGKWAIVLAFLLSFPTSAIDLSDYGDFSSRSIIMKHLEGGETANQAQRDELVSRKLKNTTECLFSQIKKGNIENVRVLLDAKVDPNGKFMSETPIYIAAKANNFEIVKLLIDRGAKLDRSFFSELFEAIRNKNSDMALYLLDNGARTHYVDSLTNKTALYYAVKYNMKDVATLMLQKGARLDRSTAILIKKKKWDELLPQ